MGQCPHNKHVLRPGSRMNHGSVFGRGLLPAHSLYPNGQLPLVSPASSESGWLTGWLFDGHLSLLWRTRPHLKVGQRSHDNHVQRCTLVVVARTPSAPEKTAPSHSGTRGRVFGCHYRSHVRFVVEGHARDAATNAPSRGL